jgi:hypothetical protein
MSVHKANNLPEACRSAGDGLLNGIDEALLVSFPLILATHRFDKMFGPPHLARSLGDAKRLLLSFAIHLIGLGRKPAQAPCRRRNEKIRHGMLLVERVNEILLQGVEIREATLQLRQSPILDALELLPERKDALGSFCPLGHRFIRRGANWRSH